jgi:hypothetical protein
VELVGIFLDVEQLIDVAHGLDAPPGIPRLEH